MQHYYSEKQTTEFNPKKIKLKVNNMELELYSASGVFSIKRLDKGSKLLIENAKINKNWTVLDLGCGSGVVGISIKKLYPSSVVVMSDINERAIKLARLNAKLHNLTIKVVKSNIFEKINGNFDTILINPPQTAGKDICYKMIEGSFNHLKPGGLLQLVARHNKGGRMLSEKMQQVFGNSQDLVKKSGYRVYVSKLQSTTSK